VFPTTGKDKVFVPVVGFEAVVDVVGGGEIGTSDVPDECSVTRRVSTYRDATRPAPCERIANGLSSTSAPAQARLRGIRAHETALYRHVKKTRR
jgi:hypothetical protein